MIKIVITPEGEKTWVMDMSRDMIFDNASTRTSYLNQRKAVELRDDKFILMDDDRGLFEKHFNGAVAKLVVMLARYFKTELGENSIDATGAHFVLSLGENGKDSIAYSLDYYCTEFIEAYILGKWFGADAESIGINDELIEVEDNLKSASRYQKNTVQRTIGPIF